VYSTEVDGEVLSFGTSGLLYRSNKLMYDRGSETLWVQFQGRPAVGPLAGSGIELEVLPVTLTTWSDWVDLHPETTVLDPDTGVYPESAYLPESDERSIYFEYRENDGPIFPIHGRSALLPEKSLVLGLSVDGLTKAYPLGELEESPVINDAIGGTNIVVIATDDARGARAYERRSLSFSDPVVEDGVLSVVDASGRRWYVGEEVLVLDDEASQSLPRLESRLAYWFGWYQYHPGTEVYEATP
jgi:hypothetical protein